MSDEMQPQSEAEGRSLDLVQRTVISVLVGVVMGIIAGALVLYLAISGPNVLARSDVIGLWIMTGVLGLLTAAAILIINQRRPYHPAVLIGLMPMAAAWPWVF
ncbi:MAG TPA: hypothetical protein VFP34_14145 [Microlunatus sp.]|nr:hypothetical protein [Microlunatus sp.]